MSENKDDQIIQTTKKSQRKHSKKVKSTEFTFTTTSWMTPLTNNQTPKIQGTISRVKRKIQNQK